MTTTAAEREYNALVGAAREELDRFITRHCTTTEDRGGDGGFLIHRGFTLGGGYSLRVPDTFRLVEAWSDEPFRWVWCSDDLLSIITYCEGDIDVTRHHGLQPALNYRNELEQCEEFYQEH